MSANVNEWDARHRESAEAAPRRAASIVSEWLPLLPTGPALDLACGTGRHTMLLAARGQAVVAVDWSGVALDVLESRARKGKLSVNRMNAWASADARMRGIHTVQANLEEIRLVDASFSLILCLQYLQRSLFSQMASALKPGGMLLFETFTRAQRNYSGGPSNPAYLLEPGELRAAFSGLDVLFYRELNAGQGIASLVGQKRQKNK